MRVVYFVLEIYYKLNQYKNQLKKLNFAFDYRFFHLLGRSSYMAGTILTPTAIWSDFKITKPIESKSIGVYKHGELEIERMYLTGKDCVDGSVQIYGVMARNIKKEKAPAIFILQKFSDGADEKLAVKLAELGYNAFVCDVSGEDGVNHNHTSYPKSLSFFDYKNAEGKLFSVGKDIKETCWYQWGTTARYALEYLSTRDFVTEIGAIGIGDAATVLWHIAGTDKRLACTAFISNAGWGGYYGNYKFSQNVENEFTDEELMFMAGIDPQTYAGNVTCPTFIAVPTNSNQYDFDRAHDTYARVKGECKAIHYSVGKIDEVDAKAYDNLIKFFSSQLPLDEKPKVKIPKALDIKGELVSGKFKILLTPDTNELKKLTVYAAEEELNPSLRQWTKITECVRGADGNFIFEYLPYCKSKIVFFFGVAEYQEGFEIGSDVIARRFTEKDVALNFPSKVIYSSREKHSSCAFYSLKGNEKKPSSLSIKDEVSLIEKKGAMDIVGITSAGGLLSFRINSVKYKPQSDAIFMLDAYLKQDGVITVKLIADYFGKQTSYQANAKVKGGEIWNNIKFELKNFKTEVGLNLKSFDKIEAITINADKEFLINNVVIV